MHVDPHISARSRDVHIRVAPDLFLQGTLSVPGSPVGLVLFAHGSGSSRFSPRNRHVAQRLQEQGFATLLLDLLSPHEEQLDLRGGRFRFDVALLARRLGWVGDWARAQPEVASLPMGLFGASTGAAAALVAAAERPDRIQAVVSRGGRPDLAGEALAEVRCPTLLIVGGADHPVKELNDRARRAMRCEVELSIVPEATHLFEEPGALAIVARRAAEWFARYLRPAERMAETIKEKAR
jgi:putative phosphoribosyl transferase